MKIEVTITEKGYTLFTINDRAVLAYQKVDGVHHLIPTERPSRSFTDPLECSMAIRTVLKEEGGDVHEFGFRPDNPFQFPL